MEIEGTGYGGRSTASVTARKQLVTFGNDRTIEADLNEQGRYWCGLLPATTPSGATNPFAALTNTDSALTILVSEILLKDAAAESIYVLLDSNPTLTVTSSTSPTLACMKAGIGNTPNATWQAGTGITGSTSGIAKRCLIAVPAASYTSLFVPRGGILLPPGTRMLLLAGAGSNAIEGHVLFGFLNQSLNPAAP